MTIAVCTVMGNDGVYLSGGGVFYPVKESNISIAHETLSFKVEDNEAQVSVYFEFYSPGSTTKELMVGFQVPTAGGDIPDEWMNRSTVTDFTTMKDGEILSYELMAAECDTCILKDTSEITFSYEEPGVFVFLTKMIFQPGINAVHHSYRFPAGSSVSAHEIYHYILTTGARWSGQTIKDLVVEFDLGNDEYFFVEDVFGEKAEWKIIGTGKVTDKYIDFYPSKARMIRILDGKLQVTVQDFTPTEDISFGTLTSGRLTTLPWEYEQESIKIENALLMYEVDESLTKEELRLVRNTIFAQKGYVFKSEDLKDYFSKQPWYIPNPDLKQEDIQLTEREKRFIDQVKRFENRR